MNTKAGNGLLCIGAELFILCDLRDTDHIHAPSYYSFVGPSEPILKCVDDDVTLK